MTMHYTDRDLTPPTLRLLTSDAQGLHAGEIGGHRDQEVSPTVLHRDREVSPTDARKKSRSRRRIPLAGLLAFALACALLALPNNASASGFTRAGAAPAPVFRDSAPIDVFTFDDQRVAARLTTGSGGHIYDPRDPNGDGSNITFHMTDFGDYSHFEILNSARDGHPRGTILFRTTPDYENPTDKRIMYRESTVLRFLHWSLGSVPYGPWKRWDRAENNQYWLMILVRLTDAQGRGHYSGIVMVIRVIKNQDKVAPVFTDAMPRSVWITENQINVTPVLHGRHFSHPADPYNHHPRGINIAITNNWGDGGKFDFSSTPVPGTLVFQNAPDHENPTDVLITEQKTRQDGTTYTSTVSSAQNNSYFLEITASAKDSVGTWHTAKHRMGVRVTNEWDTPPQKPVNLRQTAVGSGAGESGRTVTLAWDQPVSAHRDDSPWRYGVDVYSWGASWQPLYSTFINTPRTLWLTGELRSVSSYSLARQIRLPNNGIFLVKITPSNRVAGTTSDPILVVTNGVNTHPTFSSGSQFSIMENRTSVGTATATDADPEDRRIRYELNTTFGDAALFNINPSTGALSFLQAPNYENPRDVETVLSSSSGHTSTSFAGDNVYVVKFKATGDVPDTYQSYPVGYKPSPDRARSTEQLVTINVFDLPEPPGKPDAPAVAASSQVDTNGRNKLRVSWRAPTNAGPPINDYDVQYRRAATLPFTGNGNAVAFAGAGTSFIYTRPTGEANYQFRIQARSPEGNSPWSDWGSVVINTPPVISSANTANVAENTTSTGITVTASDTDTGDTRLRYTITGGVDAGQFTLDSTTGVLTFTNAPDYDNPTDLVSTDPVNAAGNNVYLVQVTATSGVAPRLASTSQLITVTVTDVLEPPGTPDKPTVTSGVVNSASVLNVTWTAPSNTGPAIDDYDVQYRVKVASGTPNAWTDAGHTGTATSRTLTNVQNNTTYEVQVRAHNAEGWSLWSAAGEGEAVYNSAPRFTMSRTSFEIPENSLQRIVKLTAVDDNSLDNNSYFRLVGGADKDKFKVFSDGGVWWDVWSAPYPRPRPDYENPVDVASTTKPTATAGDNVYSIVAEVETWASTVSKTVRPPQKTRQTLTITVTDVAEPPGELMTLGLAPHDTLDTSLQVSWRDPDMTRKPPITGYDLEYRRQGTGDDWTDAGHTGTGGTTFLNNLTKSVTYEVRCRAKNHEGIGPWKSTTGATNARPTFTPTSFTVAENQRSVGTFSATDSDPQDTYFFYSIPVSGGGADRQQFTIDPQGQLETVASGGLNYENPASAAGSNTYTFTANVGSKDESDLNSKGSDRYRHTSQTITVTVTDVAEPPGKPNPPTVTPMPGSSSKLLVSWRAPSNTGPAIRYHNVRYRKGTSGNFTKLDETFLPGYRNTRLEGLDANSSYQVQVRAANAEGIGPWSNAGSGSTPAFLNPEPLVGNPTPRFTSSASFSVVENTTAVGTVTAVDDDTQDNVTGYMLDGADASKFQISFNTTTRSGALSFKAAPDYETPASANSENLYLLTVSASSGTGQRVKVRSQVISVTVTDVSAPSSTAPTVTPASANSVTAAWSAASTTTGYPVTDYDVRYSGDSGLTWTDVPHTGTGRSVTVNGLSANIDYQVQVRGTSSEGTGPWSASGTGATNAPPAITVSKLYTVVENTAPATAIDTFIPSDVDTQDGTPTLVLDGGDKSQFSLSSSGKLTFRAAPDFERPTDVVNSSPTAPADRSGLWDNDYSLRLKATSGTGGRLATAYSPWFKVRVTNVPPPGKPAAPTLTAPSATPTQLDVTWTAPMTASGYPITDYDVQYREVTEDNSGAFTDSPHTGVALEHDLTNLTPGTSYQVRVSARSSEGSGPWSEVGTGTTAANAAPVFSNTTFSVPEGTSTLTVMATDADASDTVTGYAIVTDSTDSAAFTLVESGENAGTLTFNSVPDFENPTDVAHTTPAPADAAANNTYILGIEATSGDDARFASTIARIAITVTDVNEAPVLSPITLNPVEENTTAVTTVTATDPDETSGGEARDVITYTLSGADSGKFQITSPGGVLTFVTAPDYENPGDVRSTTPTNPASDNEYVVVVTATSAAGDSTRTLSAPSRTLIVEVSDALEPPAAPDAPSVEAVTGWPDRLDVTWTAPANTGKPAILHYHVQYQKSGAAGWTSHSSEIAAATTTLRITGLESGASYNVQVRADNVEGEGTWSRSGTGTTNALTSWLPQFGSVDPTYPVAENTTAVGTITATDATNADVTFSIPGTDTTGGVDRAKFSITSNGVLTFNTAPNYENPQDVLSATPANAAGNNEYIVKVEAAASGRGSSTQTVTVRVTDVDEKPGKPLAPTVRAANATPTKLSVTWTAPTNTGPDINDYDVQYRAGSTGQFTDASYDGTGTSTTLTGLTQGTAYEVQVRATSPEDTGPWSDSGSATTAGNAPPSFTTMAFSVVENITGVGTVTATDSDSGDSITRYAITDGADSTKFSITETGANIGKLVFSAAPDFEANGSAASNNTYKVEITATSGTADRQATKAETFTITVTNATEKPIAPGRPTVNEVATNPAALSVSWTAPANAGKPAITGYQLQYRKGSTGTFSSAAGTVTGTSTTLRGLDTGTSYQVRVQATNADGDSTWSDPGTGSTATNVKPTFSSTTLSVAENETTVDTVTATDSDASDSVTRYQITGGADRAKFSITETGTNIGKLVFDSAPDYEANGSAASNNTYKIHITVTSGTGARQLTTARAFTITVTDAPEPPIAPDAPSVSAVENWPDRLDVTWTAPANTGKPAIQHYHVRYGVDEATVSWTEKTGTADEITGTLTTRLTGLASGGTYQVQVRADNAEGTGTWSDSGKGTTTALTALLPPAFGSVNPLTYDVEENTTAVGTITPTNTRVTFSIPTTAATGGVDRAKFSITSSGVLTFVTAPDYEDAQDVLSTSPSNAANNNEYIVKVKAAASGWGSVTQTAIVRVTNVNEPPAAPQAPSVSAVENWPDRLDVTWIAPLNTGKPAIQHYHVRYGVDGASVTWTEKTGTADEITGTLTTRLTGLSSGETYQVQVRADNAEGTGTWSRSGTGTTNALTSWLPQFGSVDPTYDVAENTTAVQTITATDATNAQITFSIPGTDATGGVDRAKFSITAGGVLTFVAAPNYEDAQDVESTSPVNAAGNNEYIVKVEAAASGRGSATQTVTVRVTNVREKPGKPLAPTVRAANATPTRLSVTWAAPTNTGPAIDDYDVQYRAGSTGSFTDANYDGTGTSTTLTGLTQGTLYEVQVRATSPEDTGPWSDSGSATTAGNAKPSFTTTALSVEENLTSVGTVTATDSDTGDNVTGYAITGGADETKFSITAATGALVFQTAPDYEAKDSAASNNSYKVEITATSGTGARLATTAATFTITVTNATEKPIAPGMPTVNGVTTNPAALSVSWSAPANAGKPAITGYQLQYRKGSENFTLAAGTVTGTSTTLRGLDTGTSYDVEVRAVNVDGESLWSDTGTGTTTTNVKPSFTSSATFSVVENNTAVGTVTATDSDADDNVTGYAVTGGADSAKFSITALTGALVFSAAPDYEANASAAGNNTYKVQVTATSGTGARLTTAAQAITVTVTDATEKPLVPTGLKITATTLTSLTAGWNAPNNVGKPALRGYDVQYRQGNSDGWTDAGHTGVGTSQMLSSLTQNTSYQVRVLAKNDDGSSGWTSPVTGTTETDTAPSFTSLASFSLDENTTTVGTVVATDADTGDSILRYAITGGADQAKFSITETGANIGKLVFSAAPDYEANASAAGNNTYKVEVTATSGAGARSLSTAQSITVTVNDAEEPPAKPGTPVVQAVAYYVDKLDVSWTAPANTGKPPITDYDVQYQKNGAASWETHTHDGTGVTTQLTGLDENTKYFVKVQAISDEGETWSDAGSGRTNVNAVLLPEFEPPEGTGGDGPTIDPPSGIDALYTVAENTTAVATITATDRTNAQVTFSIPQTDGGVDRAKFEITRLGGELRFASAPNFENPQDLASTSPSNAAGNNEYIVKVTATGRGSATQTVRVTVTDVDEKPGKPLAPTVRAANATPTQLSVTWAAPTNTGPAITDYDVQYRAGSTGSFTDASYDGTVTSTTLTGLTQGTLYEVQVRATSPEDTGSWSDSGSGTTAGNAKPSFTKTTFSVEENLTSVGTVTATDADSGDTVTGYAITGGADSTKFSITEATGALVFQTAPDYEAKGSAASNNSYKVEITATSGTGARLATTAATFTITVTNATEKPIAPGRPTVEAVTTNPAQLSVSWSEPANAGKPAITGYQLQYRKGNTGNFTLAAGTVTETSTTLRGLDTGTSYQVQVLAKNADGKGPWSASGSGSTATNAAPSFSTTSLSVDENETAVGTVTATDADTDDTVTGYAITGGADETKFSITASTGALVFQTAPDYEANASAAGNNTYKVQITATSGTGARILSKAQRITVTVNNVDEPPAKPGTPVVQAVAHYDDKLNVSWTAPANTGKPAITDYNVQYQKNGAASWETHAHDGTGVTTQLTGLDENTKYFVKVQAISDEGETWSDAGSGRTNVNAVLLPEFEPPEGTGGDGPTIDPPSGIDALYTVAENTTAVATITATDATNAQVTFSIPTADATGGVDRARFEITTDGRLTFVAAPDYENPQDVASTSPTNAAGNNEYIVKVQATATGRGSATQTVRVTVTDVNEGPAFSAASAFSVAENTTAVDTVTATDPDRESDGTTARDSITYTVEGTDASLFTIGSTGALSFATAPNFEVPGDSASVEPENAAKNNEYLVTVKATSGTVARAKSAKLALVVTVTDMPEKPGKPAKPTVTAVTNSVTKLDVSWNPPDNTGPPISGYNVQYRKGTIGAFTDISGDITTVSKRLTSLLPETSYDVRVRAKSVEGTGDWSDVGTGTTNAYSDISPSQDNRRPRFTTGNSFSVQENSTAVTTVNAVDDDSGDGAPSYEITGGADSAKFSITASTGKLAFQTAPDYEAKTSAAGNNTYKVQITATTGGNGDRRLTASQNLTITVTNANEPPGQPTGLTVNGSTTTPMQLDVSWTAPTVPTSIPSLSGYDVQYRKGTSGSWSSLTHTGTGVTAAITSLTAGASYQVRVRAKNSEGKSAWAQEDGTTAGNAKPIFSTTSFDVDENITAVGTVTATDADSGDSITRYAITGGADSTKFSITETGANIGKLVFSAAPNYEANASAAGNNTYKVQITATSGTGARQATNAETFTITVTNVLEAPAKPEKPTVTGLSEYPKRLKISWTAPTNMGPPIDEYQLQYRQEGVVAFTKAAGTVRGTSTTLRGFTQGTTYEVQVQAKNDEDTSPWSDTGSGSTAANADAVFANSSTASVDENSPITTNILTLNATDADADDNVSGYAVTGGADAGAFTIADTNKLRFTTVPNHESPTDAASTSPSNAARNNEYIVVVKATSGTGERMTTAKQTLTITVADVREPPGKPAAPSIPVATLTTLKVSWTAPANAGKPTIDDYDVQYAKNVANPTWLTQMHVGAGTTTTLTGLATGTTYQVRVMAKNDEGDSDWSDASTGTTIVNRGPAFSSDAATASVDENSATTTNIYVLSATDADPQDSVTGYTVTGGADKTEFKIEDTNKLRLKNVPDYEAQSSYVVEVKATSGAGARALQSDALTITVSVNDVPEPPNTPDAPSITETALTTLKVSWTPRDNEGKPPITDYDVRYGKNGANPMVWVAHTHTGAGRSTTLTDLDTGTNYDVQVKARNDEGASDWSPSGKGMTIVNKGPKFETSQVLGIDENQVYVGLLTAMDPDEEVDTTFTYKIVGGVDRDLFEIGASVSNAEGQFASVRGAESNAQEASIPGLLKFKSGMAPDYENPEDSDKNREYIVTVEVTSGTGARAMSTRQDFKVKTRDVGPPQVQPPVVDQVVGDGTKLEVRWAAPVVDISEPPINGYQVQYRIDKSGQWTTERDYEGTELSEPVMTLRGLKPSTPYEVQVRARSLYGDTLEFGAWSDSGQDTTDRADPARDGSNSPPRFMSKAQPTIPENTMPVITLVAVDDDEQDKIMGFEITGGADAAMFMIENHDELRFKKAPDYEAMMEDSDSEDGDGDDGEQTNADELDACIVEVMATSGTGKRAKTVKQMLSVRVTDVSGPERPAKPKVSSVAGSTSKLRVKWRAPESFGLPISDYDVQYRADSAGAWKNAKYDGTGTSTDLTGLAAKETYLVQVRARNSEGRSPWSPSGSGSPSAEPTADAPDTDSGDPDEEGELPPDGAPAVPVIIEHKTVVINEIGNRTEDKYDWVELFNRAYEDISLKDWSLSIVDKSVVHDVARDALESADGSMHDVELVHFKTDITIPARGYLLVMHSDPLAKENPLAGGIALATPREKPLPGQEQLMSSLPLSQCYIDTGLSLPDGDFLLILRDSATAEGTDEHLRDVAGNYYKPALVGAEPTLMWPLILDVRDVSNFNFRSDEVWARENTRIDGFCENAFVQAPYTGVGYDRAIAPTDAGGKHSGTPGYANDALKTKAADLEDPNCVSISEVMFVTDTGTDTAIDTATDTVARGPVPRNGLPQWIEVFNCSETEAVSMENWRLEIRNRRNGGARAKATLIFNQALLIPPRQTVLLVSSSERAIKPRTAGRGLISSEPWPTSEHLPDAYIYSLYDEAAAQLRMTSRNDKVLSLTGFTLTLKDMTDEVVDVVGNHVEGEPIAWQLPVSKSKSGARSSMLRRYVDGDAVDGQSAEAWVSAAETHLAGVQNGLYYGDATDISTPGYRGSMLTTFEMAATGTSIELTWQTASESNTAGFYVLRCDTRDGEFVTCNDLLIPGAGTTSTPQTYAWTDAKKTAGVAYWYRLEEESFAGVRQVLAKQQLTFAKADVNGDGEVNVQDLVFAAAGNGQPVPQAQKQNPDVNGDGIVNPKDVQAVLGVLEAKPGAAPAYPRLTANLLQPWIDEAKRLNLPDATFQRGIRELERLAAALAIPKETALLPNYPNPFNPETWIPYDLAEAVSVTLTFYDVRGRVVRTLALGHRPAGAYRTKARAAYWDGRNAQGERVASGVYFYTFTAGDFTATGKLVVRK